MSERDREQLKLWLEEAESDDVSVLGVEDRDEREEDFVEEPNEVIAAEDDSENVVEEEEDITPDREDITEPFDAREFYIGREKRVAPSRWYVEPVMSRNAITSRLNIIPAFHRPGPQGTGNAKKCSIPS